MLNYSIIRLIIKIILKKISIERIALELPELQGEPEDIVKEKARIACKMSGKAVVVEDIHKKDIETEERLGEIELLHINKNAGELY